jgi:hypothetical protein
MALGFVITLAIGSVRATCSKPCNDGLDASNKIANCSYLLATYEGYL